MTAAFKKQDEPSFAVPVEADGAHRRLITGGEPHVFHCHHFNTYLQQSIRDAEETLDVRGTLHGAATEVAHAQMTALIESADLKDIDARLSAAETLFRWAGFGVVKLQGVAAEGGTVRAPHSHYSEAWRIKFGPSQERVAYFDRGWIAGALAACFDRPVNHFSVEQTACIAHDGTDSNTYEISVASNDGNLQPSAGVGPLTDHAPITPPASDVDYDGIMGAVQGLPLTGDEEGKIAAFGVYLTRHYANYYNRISFAFYRGVIDRFGDVGASVAEPLLVESGHVCAFNTFGGIMKSSEWAALIEPSLKSKEDWVQGMVAVVNALGWGRWQVEEVSEDSATFVIFDDYEEIGYLAAFGVADRPMTFLARGAAAGIMNLVYYGDIASGPELNVEFYDKLFKGDGAYSAEVLQAQSMGADCTKLRVTKSG